MRSGGGGGGGTNAAGGAADATSLPCSLAGVAEEAAESVVTHICHSFAYGSAELLEPRRSAGGGGESWKSLMRFVELRESHRARLHKSLTAASQGCTAFATATATATTAAAAATTTTTTTTTTTATETMMAQHEVFVCGANTNGEDVRFIIRPPHV